jgi:branched-chain amino acid transport system substrate-binding protein
VIGNVGTYSGVIGSIFSGVQQSLKVAVAYVNAHGGLNGHPIDLVSADDGGDPSTNETEVQTMVEQDHAVAFVAEYTPLSSSGSEQFLASRGIPVVGGDLYDPNWYGNPYWFPQGTSLEPGIATSFLTLAGKLGKPKVGYLYCIETPICSGAASYDQSHPIHGVQIVYTAPVSLTQPSFTAQCLDAHNHGVQIMAVAADPASLGRVGQDCAAQGVKIQLMEPAVSTTVSQESNPNLAGLLAPLEDFLWFQGNTPATQAFHQAFQTYLPGLPLSENSAEVWTAVQLLRLGSTQLSASNPTSSQVVAGLDALGTTNIGGLSPASITFRKGSPATATGCYEVAEVVNGAWSAPDGYSPVCNS